MLIKPRTGDNKKDTAWETKAEFFSVLDRFGLNPRAPNFAFKTDMRRHSWSNKTLLKVAGVAVVATITWTLVYDNLSKGVLEAKRETYITDTVTNIDYITATVVFLTTTGTSLTWTKDPTWNDSINKVEIVACGGKGSAGIAGKSPLPGSGGGGGAYTFKSNVTLSGNPGYQNGDGSVNGTNTDTWFISAADVMAKAGTGAAVTSQANGGAAASCVPSANAFSGGACLGASTNFHRGGGGAAGPHGAGGNSTGGANSLTGGTGDNGNTAINTAGTQFDATHGSGGGASKASTSSAGEPGPLYGGGSAGGARSGGAAANGGQGLIVLTWTPVSGGTHRFFMVIS